jgi:tellurite resistance protein
MLLLLLLPLLALGVYLAYRCSPAASARKMAGEAVGTLEALVSELESQKRSVQEAASRSASDYAQEVRLARLRAIPVEELRRHSTGLRLQPIKDAGLRTLADLQSWSGQRLSQLRGVGPKSAGTIAYVVAGIIRQSDSLPIPHPVPSAAQGPGCTLLQSTYLLRWSQAWMPEKEARLRAVVGEFQARFRRIASNTHFLRWASSLGKNPEIHYAVAEARVMAAELQGQHAAAQLRAEIGEILTTLRKLKSSGVEWTWVAKDYAENHDFYESVLNRHLGNSAGSVPPNHGVAAVAPVTVAAASQSSRPVVRIPGPPPPQERQSKPQVGSPFWVPPGKDAKVAGYTIQGGMVYVGRGLASVCWGGQDPALIDPSLTVAKSGVDCHVRMTNYWPSYEGITPEARASYLQWLATGKADPEADIGYVFLYFYGLERRALADSLYDPQAKAELPGIEQEVRRLLGIYSNASFCNYAGSFLNYLTVQNAQLDNLVISSAKRGWELSAEMRIGLGLHAKAGRPLPAEWALDWYLSAPEIRRGITVTRCPDAFAQCFKTEFEKRFGDGLKLPVNKTRIKVPYRTASLSFGGSSFTAEVDVPDVSVLSGPISRLKDIGDATAAALAQYSRFVGAHPDKLNSREALLLLPIAAWPEPFRTALQNLSKSVSTNGQFRLLPLQDVLALLPAGEDLNRVSYVSLARALGGAGLGIEPDIRLGGGLPAAGESIALFSSSELEDSYSPSRGFASAALTLQMAALVVSGDGTYHDRETELLTDFINRHQGLSVAERARLVARLQLYRAVPPTSAGLKKRIEGSNPGARDAISAFLLRIAFADGIIEPEEVKALEKLFGLLGLDQKSLYSRLHDLEAQARPVQPLADGASAATADAGGPARSDGIRLNASRIADLEADSAKVAALLGSVFTEPPPVPEESEPEADEQQEATLLGLGTEHAGLLQVLMQRAQWTRGELEEVCADRGLMLDGAIERINEAAYASFDQALIEGDDPVEVNSQLVLEGNPA